MIMIKKSSVLRTCLGIGIVLSVVSVQADIDKPATDAFKDFLHSPPVVESLVAIQEWPEMKITNVFFLRWQQNAFLLAQSDASSLSETNISQYTNLNAYTYVYSKYENEYWSKRPTTLFKWTDIGRVNDKTNTVAYAYETVLKNVVPLISGGMGMWDTVGQISWAENSFDETNSLGIHFSGKLFKDNSDKVKSITVDFSGLDSESKQISGKWTYSYAYSNDAMHLSFYPAYIHASNGFITVNYRFYLLSTTTIPLGVDKYLLDITNYNDVSFVKILTNNSIIETSYWKSPVLTPEEEKKARIRNLHHSIIKACFVVFSITTFAAMLFLSRKQVKK